MGHTAPINRFNNTSGPNLENNYGNKGKFTPEQAKERLKLHAMAVATGYPTHQQIVDQWKDRFGIEISVQSEKEWRKSNKNRIEVEKQRLIEIGEIEVPVISDKVLADNMNVLVTENCRLNTLVRQKITKLIRDIDTDKLDEMDPNKLKNKMMVFEAYSAFFDKTTNAIVKSFDKMSDFAGKVKSANAKADHDEEKLKLLDAPDDDEAEFNPASAEISDEDRARLK
jgi:hypothetical protein